MTNTKVLEKVTVIAGEKDGIVKQHMLEDFLTEIRAEIATEINKKAGKGNQSKIIKKIIKENIKEQPYKTQFHKACIMNEIQYVASMWRVLGFVLPSTDVETIDWEQGNLNYKNLFPADFGEKLITPNIGKLKTYFLAQKAELKEKKSKEKPLFCFGDKIIRTEYIIDAIEAIPEIIFYKMNNDKWNQIMVGKDEKGNKALICPVKPKGLSDNMTKEEKNEAIKKSFEELLAEQAKYGL